MKLLGYKGNSPGLAGLVDRLIRFRLDGKFSHTEVMFEPGDGVEHLMPDGLLEPINGHYWCASSSGMDRIPFYSTYRANEFGGVRFKRIKPNLRKWDIIPCKKSDPVQAALVFVKLEGYKYDYKLILGYINFFMRNTKDRLICSEVCAQSLGYKDPWRYDPCLLMGTVSSEQE